MTGFGRIEFALAHPLSVETGPYFGVRNYPRNRDPISEPGKLPSPLPGVTGDPSSRAGDGLSWSRSDPPTADLKAEGPTVGFAGPRVESTCVEGTAFVRIPRQGGAER